LDISEYCRQIESYLCRKNDGHLIRVVGPSFELVSRWASDGVPFKVACRGIDRACERYYRKGPRRRPIRIDFCEADVLEAYDEWRRATGLTAGAAEGEDETAPRAERRGPSLPEHLERALIRLTNARATGALGDAADPMIDAVSRSLDDARRTSGGLRGDARRAATERLAALDLELLSHARESIAPEVLAALERDANAELAAFREQMPPDRFARALQVAVERLLRARLGLPTLTFS
jgi:hypothetical protein